VDSSNPATQQLHELISATAIEWMDAAASVGGVVESPSIAHPSCTALQDLRMHVL